MSKLTKFLLLYIFPIICFAKLSPLNSSELTEILNSPNLNDALENILTYGSIVFF